MTLTQLPPAAKERAQELFEHIIEITTGKPYAQYVQEQNELLVRLEKAEQEKLLLEQKAAAEKQKAEQEKLLLEQKAIAEKNKSIYELSKLLDTKSIAVVMDMKEEDILKIIAQFKNSTDT